MLSKLEPILDFDEQSSSGSASHKFSSASESSSGDSVKKSEASESASSSARDGQKGAAALLKRKGLAPAGAKKTVTIAEASHDASSSQAAASSEQSGGRHDSEKRKLEELQRDLDAIDEDLKADYHVKYSNSLSRDAELSGSGGVATGERHTEKATNGIHEVTNESIPSGQQIKEQGLKVLHFRNDRENVISIDEAST